MSVTWHVLDSQVMSAYLTETSERSVLSWYLEVQGSGQLKINHALQRYDRAPHLRFPMRKDIGIDR